jgi:fumarylacetoacetate (FAA) hydrolase
MKLATYHDGSRDGQLVVVSRDLSRAHYATGIATRLQQVLDDWNFLAPQLEELSTSLNHGKARHAFPFEPRRCLAPLPRAYQWADGSAYSSHMQRLRAARGQPMPEDYLSDPPVYQGGSDDFLGPCADAVFADAGWGIDFEAELAVVTGDVACGTGAQAALDHVRLLMLANDWSLRALVPAELAKGFGFFQSKPATAFAPVALTPDELGAAWRDGRAAVTVEVQVNGRRVGRLDASAGMSLHFGALIAHIVRTRRLRAGAIVGGGTISEERAEAGIACLAERRATEAAGGAEPVTPWLAFGDRVRIEAFDADGASLFGAIDQAVAPPR